MLRSIICSLGLCAAIVSATSVSAQETVSVHVSYADLNLGSPAGLAVFQRRIKNAVEEICGPDERNLDMQAEISRCKARVQATAQPQANAAINAARTTQFASRATDRTVTLGAR